MRAAAAAGGDAQSTNGEAAERCAALAQQSLGALPDAPTRITGAQFVGARVAGAAHCEVRATVFPQVGLAILLPGSGWNGKLLEVGCGSYCGTIELGACRGPLQRGYACVASDMGHQADPGDTRWAAGNLPAQFDFANRAAHVVLLAARAIADHYYAQPIRRSYFMGCSTGGYLGMIEAQRFPWDFDGIVAGDPDMDEADLLMRSVWAWRSLHDAAGKALLSRTDLQLLHAGALARCDMSDGVKDGIIGDPVGCPFRGAELLCQPGQRNGCLSAAQAAAARARYEGPTTAAGRRLSTRGAFPGSELSWLPDDAGAADAIAANAGPGDLGYDLYVPSPGQQWREVDFNFERDYQRLGLGTLYNDTNPDLRRLRDAGGKLLVYQGGSDALEMAAIYDYYDNVEKLMGGRAATQEFFRLYTVPGMGHCGGGDGADIVDYLGYLDAWVEQGKAPDALIGAHVPDEFFNAPGAPSRDVLLQLPLDSHVPVSFTRPLYPYPAFARYRGSGDANDARNFEAVEPAQR